jgi:hypothetical protein
MVRINWKGIRNWLSEETHLPIWFTTMAVGTSFMAGYFGAKHEAPEKPKPHVVTDREAANLDTMCKWMRSLDGRMEHLERVLDPKDGMLPRPVGKPLSEVE